MPLPYVVVVASVVFVSVVVVVASVVFVSVVVVFLTEAVVSLALEVLMIVLMCRMEYV